jgi:hypothetical protein
MSLAADCSQTAQKGCLHSSILLAIAMHNKSILQTHKALQVKSACNRSLVHGMTSTLCWRHHQVEQARTTGRHNPNGRCGIKVCKRPLMSTIGNSCWYGTAQLESAWLSTVHMTKLRSQLQFACQVCTEHTAVAS